MKRLVRLSHPELEGCYRLNCMPYDLGCLTNVHKLTTFMVDKRSGSGARISELLGVSWLGGGLIIGNLERQRSNIEEVESSKFLLHMKYLERLSLTWLLFSLVEEFREEVEHKDEMILGALERPHTIKTLDIVGFLDKCLLEWIGSLILLQVLTLDNYSALTSLPKFIGSFTSLQRLCLVNCSPLASLTDSIKCLTSLQYFGLDRCSALMKRYGQQLEGFDWPELSHIPDVCIS